MQTYHNGQKIEILATEINKGKKYAIVEYKDGSQDELPFSSIDFEEEERENHFFDSSHEEWGDDG